MNDSTDRQLDERVRDLPRSIAPDRDLWGDIAARIEHKRGTLRFFYAHRRALWTGALATLAAAASLVVALRRRDALAPHVTVARPPVSAPVPSEAEPRAPEAPRDPYALAVRELEESFAARRAHLPPAAAARIQASLAVLDQAIGATQKALAAHPDSPELNAQLRDEYQQKADALTQVVELAMEER